MSSGSKKVIIAALVGNSLITITKFIAASLTRSSAMLSEGIHSLVDTGNQVLLLFGMRQAKKPASELHPYGRGKEIYFWSFVVAILIFALGAGISIYEGIKHILHPVPIENPMINYIVLGCACLFEGAAWMVALKEFSKTKGETGYLEAVHRGKDPTTFLVLFEDSAALLGLLVAFIGILLGQITGNPLYDGVASVIIGLILGVTALWLAIETKSLLIGEGARKEMLREIRKTVQACAEIEKVNEILTMHMGPDYILVTISLDFNNQITASQVEASVKELDGMLKKMSPLIKKVFIEARSIKSGQPPDPKTHGH